MADDTQQPESKGSPWLKELYDLFAPVRDAYAESGMTEDEINADIDAAVCDARAERRMMATIDESDVACSVAAESSPDGVHRAGDRGDSVPGQR
jgi:hypothetical protein